MAAGWLSLAAAVTSFAAAAQQGPFVYLPDNGDNAISIVDSASNSVLPETVGVGGGPRTAAVLGDQSFVYVTKNVAHLTAGVKLEIWKVCL